MAYGQFASIYDQFMYDQPYHQWLNIITPYLKDDLLDLATGTGNFITLIPDNIKVTAIDLSEEMLSIAKNKRNNTQFIVQNIAELNLNQQFSCITCLCDSINYLQDESDVIATFKHVSDHLKPGGTFIFDVHSTKKFDAYFDYQTYSDEIEDMLYVWHTIPGEVEYSVFHDLSFFVKQGELYLRFDEQHYQQTYHIKQYTHMLEQTGLKVEHVFADFDTTKFVDDTTTEYFDRVFFIVKKDEI